MAHHHEHLQLFNSNKVDGISDARIFCSRMYGNLNTDTVVILDAWLLENCVFPGVSHTSVQDRLASAQQHLEVRFALFNGLPAFLYCNYYYDCYLLLYIYLVLDSG